MLEDKEQRLSNIQKEIDDFTSKYIEEDFKLKLAHHQNISKFLDERDRVFSTEFTREELLEFYEKVFANFDPLKEFFPAKEDLSSDVSFMKSIKAEYLDGYRMKVTLELHENDYMENTKLEKTIYLTETDPEPAKIVWKNGGRSCPLFDFFENGEDDLETFDILYEFYVDMLFLADMYSD